MTTPNQAVQFSMKDLLNEQALKARQADLAHAHQNKGKESQRLARAVDAKAIKAFVDTQRAELGQDSFKLDLAGYNAFKTAEIARLASEGVGAHQFTATLSARLDVSRYTREVRRHATFNGRKNVGSDPADMLAVELVLVELEQADVESNRIGLRIDGEAALIGCNEQSPACTEHYLPQAWENRSGYTVGNFTVEATVNQPSKGEVKCVCGPCAHEINSPIYAHNAQVSACQKQAAGKPLDAREQKAIARLTAEEAKEVLAKGFLRPVRFTDLATAQRDSEAILGARQQRQERGNFRQQAVAMARGAGQPGRGGRGGGNYRHNGDSGRQNLPPRGMSRKQLQAQRDVESRVVYRDGDSVD